MATLVKAADRHTVVATGWTNPQNAYDAITGYTDLRLRFRGV